MRKSDHLKRSSSVRIIGGRWKRSVLPVIHTPGLRPTPDRVRETVFNWLQHMLSGQWNSLTCLDLFAGTGALGFEAASRGAQQVWLIEKTAAAVAQLRANKEKLSATQIEILQTDAVDFLRQQNEQSIDLVFVDPPYAQDWLIKVLPDCMRIVKPSGWLYVEAEFALDDAFLAAQQLDRLTIQRADCAGMVFYHLLQRSA